MLATMYSVRCDKCGGDTAPIVSGQHLGEYCQDWRNRATKTLESLEAALEHKLNQKMPPDSLPDNVAIPMLNRLEARQVKLSEAFETIRTELNR